MAQIYFSLFIIALVGIVLYPKDSLGLGINCRGSGECSSYYNDIQDVITSICNQSSSQLFGPGTHIGTDCAWRQNDGNWNYAGLAAFTQSTSNAISGGTACELAKELMSHGCAACGSIPLNPGNNVVDGQLTINYVSQC